jgi:D-3-phosphoglycerate dehydrogenase
MDVDYRPISNRSGRLPPEEFKEALTGVDVLIVGYEGVSPDVIDAVADLKIIACTRGGPDANVDISAATERGIPVLYTPGRNAISVADFTLGLIISVARHIADGHHRLQTGEFTGKPQTDSASGGEREDVSWGVGEGAPYTELKGPELQGKTLGLVGLGNIGQKVAARATGFGLNVVAFDPYIDEDTMKEHSVEKVSLEDLCRESDFVSIHCPVTDSTRGLIGKEEFDLMRDNAYFINTARAAIVDQNALVETLDANGLRGAALDVYDEEPIPTGHPLLGRDNVVTTPHIGGASEDVIDHHSEMIYAGIKAVLDGEKPKYVAEEEVLDQMTVRGDV